MLKMPIPSMITGSTSFKIARPTCRGADRAMLHGGLLDWRSWARRIIAIRATPRQVAMGVALGAFLAFTPLIGLQMLLAGLFATLAGASRKAAMLTVWISNPLTMGPIFAVTYYLGTWLGSPVTPSMTAQGSIQTGTYHGAQTSGGAMSLDTVLHGGAGMLMPMMLGGAVLGLIAAVAAYVLTHRGVSAYQIAAGTGRIRGKSV